VLALVAEGKTNREIGEESYLSEKTVRDYVSDILAKLGHTSRVQAAAYTARHRIADYLYVNAAAPLPAPVSGLHGACAGLSRVPWSANRPPPGNRLDSAPLQP